MNAKELLQELKPLANQRELTIKEIKKQNRPIILYGAAEKAKLVTKIMKDYNLTFKGYAVDADYYHEGMVYLGLPVFNLDELSKEPDKYSFIVAMENEIAIERIFQNKKLAVYDLDINKNVEPISYDYVKENAEKFIETYNFLTDDLSRETFMTFIKVKVSGNVSLYEGIYEPNQYFNSVISGFILNNGGGIFVDCGAWRGDTIEKFINWSQCNYKKVYGIEADTKNFYALNNFMVTRGYKNIKVFNVGVWDKKGILYFNDKGSTSSSIGNEGNVELRVDALDNLISDGKVDFIKMDIEGAELPALRGAKKLIESNKPYLAICVYHKAKDLITLPQYIKNLNKNYKLYLRQHMKFASIELVLYAIP